MEGQNFRGQMQDRIMQCQGCRQGFSFNADEQLFFQTKAFKDPKRCRNCRESKKAFQVKRWQREARESRALAESGQPLSPPSPPAAAAPASDPPPSSGLASDPQASPPPTAYLGQRRHSAPQAQPPLPRVHSTMVQAQFAAAVAYQQQWYWQQQVYLAQLAQQTQQQQLMRAPSLPLLAHAHPQELAAAPQFYNYRAVVQPVPLSAMPTAPGLLSPPPFAGGGQTFARQTSFSSAGSFSSLSQGDMAEGLVMDLSDAALSPVQRKPNQVGAWRGRSPSQPPPHGHQMTHGGVPLLLEERMNDSDFSEHITSPSTTSIATANGRAGGSTKAPPRPSNTSAGGNGGDALPQQ